MSGPENERDADHNDTAGEKERGERDNVEGPDQRRTPWTKEEMDEAEPYPLPEVPDED